MNSKTKKVANPKLHLAVLAALPLMAIASLNVSAAGVCADFTGTSTSRAVINGKSCTGGDVTLINASGTTIGVTDGNAAGNSVWIEGVGNVVTNNGTIRRTSTAGTTVGVLLGDYTVSRFSATTTTGAAAAGVTATTPASGFGKNLSLVGTGSYASYGAIGNNQLILSQVDLAAALITDSAQLVGKTIKMNGVVVDGEARAGQTAVITAFNPITGIITIRSTWTAAQAGKGFNIIAGSGDNEFTNNGTITANSTATAAATVRAIDTNVAGNYLITNTGSISASHTSIGAAQGIDVGGDVTEMTIVNSGNITATRNDNITLTTNTGASLKASSTSIPSTNLGAAAAIYSQEEAEYLSVTNTVNGIITGVGKYTPALYMRAAEQIVNNAGVINGSRQGSGSYTYGMAIGSVSDSNEVRTLDLTNSGTINGDILAVNGNAYRWSAITTEGTPDNRLSIESNQGQLDSTITNTGAINGSLYFSNGTHHLTNADGASITGNIDLDQRPTWASASTFNNGTKEFTFENTGTFTGNIKVYTAVHSDATLSPTISGAGAATSASPNTTNINSFNGALQIISTTAAGGSVANVTINPKVASGTIVHDGDFYQVATSVSTGATAATLSLLTSTATASQLPSGGDNGLVSWTPSINTTGKLVVQAEVDGANVTGASNAAQGALNSLMDFESKLSNTLQNLASTEEVRDAAEQLRPEANNASTQAVMAAANQVSSVIGAHQEAVRTASNGNSGVSTGETAQGAGFWMQGFGFKGEQKERGGVDGYTADTGGFVLGGDKTIGNGDVRVGAAFAYASTGINGEGVTTANRTDIDSYQGTVYGSYDAGAWYVDAALGYGQHQYDTKRYVALAGASITGKHDANQYLAKVGVGYPLAFGRATFTPLASLAYVNLDQDGYTETDPTASGAALTVGSTKTDSLRSGLGAKVSVPLSTGKLNTALEARAVWNHEFADTQQDIASSFVGGTSFTTNGVAQARDSANLGLGVSLNSANGQTLSVNYDAEVKSDYVSHTAAVKFRYDF